MPKELRNAALEAVEVFGIDGGSPDAKSGNQPKAKAKPAKSAIQTSKIPKVGESDDVKTTENDSQEVPIETSEDAPINKPLTFELQLDTAHPYLKERGLKKSQVKEFGLGVAKRGTMKDRLCFPIHNQEGELIGYSGRWVAILQGNRPNRGRLGGKHWRVGRFRSCFAVPLLSNKRFFQFRL